MTVDDVPYWLVRGRPRTGHAVEWLSDFLTVSACGMLGVSTEVKTRAPKHLCEACLKVIERATLVEESTT